MVRKEPETQGMAKKAVTVQMDMERNLNNLDNLMDSLYTFDNAIQSRSEFK